MAKFSSFSSASKVDRRAVAARNTETAPAPNSPAALDEPALFFDRQRLEQAKQRLPAPRYGWGVLLAGLSLLVFSVGDLRAAEREVSSEDAQVSSESSEGSANWWTLLFEEMSFGTQDGNEDENGGSTDPDTGGG